MPSETPALFWIPVEYAPWDGRTYFLTDGEEVWTGSRKRGPRHKDGAPTSGHTFPRLPTHFAIVPPLPLTETAERQKRRFTSADAEPTA